ALLRPCIKLGLCSHRCEQTAFGSEAAHPTHLRHHSLERPVVLLREELVPLAVQQRARIRAQPGKAGIAKPSAHFPKRVSMLLDVAVLIADPRLPARGL